jgi:hypothetical protein
MPPRERRFIVQHSPLLLKCILGQLANDWAQALAQGCVFVDGKRVHDPERWVNPGSQVSWYAARTDVASRGDTDFCILD